MRIKGADEPVCARRLVAIGTPDGLVGRAEATLVGRRREMATLDAVVDRAIGGRGGVVGVVGSPGIGKSRVAREVAALADGHGLDVFRPSASRPVGVLFKRELIGARGLRSSAIGQMGGADVANPATST